MYWQDSPLSVLDVYHELISAGLRIWMFRLFIIFLLNFQNIMPPIYCSYWINILNCHSGDTDGVIPVTSTRNTINALNLTTISPWRAWYEDGQVIQLEKLMVLVGDNFGWSTRGQTGLLRKN